MRFTSLVAAVAVTAAAPAFALIAWSGNKCDGNQGATVPNDGSCHSFANRHSFTGNAEFACVEFFQNPGCTGTYFIFTNQGQKCTNVNTGTNIQSFRAYYGAGGCPLLDVGK